MLNRQFENFVKRRSGPGVSAIVSLNHAMFMRGSGDDFRSTQDGDFAQLDAHLGWVRKKYPAVQFATATEAGLDLIDYHTPELKAVVGRLLRYRCNGVKARWSVRLLGEGIPVSSRFPHELLLTLPLFCDDAFIDEISMYQEGRQLQLERVDSEIPQIRFGIASRDPLELEVTFSEASTAFPLPLDEGYPTDIDPTAWVENRPPMDRTAVEVVGLHLVSVPVVESSAKVWEGTIPSSVMSNVLVEFRQGVPLARSLHPFTSFRSAALFPALSRELGSTWDFGEVHMNLDRPWDPSHPVDIRLTVEQENDVDLLLGCTQDQLGERITDLTLRFERCSHHGSVSE